MAASTDHADAAGVFTVDTTVDTVDANPGDGTCADASSNCTLRAAIMEANALAGADTITLPAGTYTLSIAGAGEDAAATGDLDVTDDLTISGAGAATTIIDGGALDRVFDVLGPGTVNQPVSTVEIAGVTIRNGNTLPSGGGIYSDHATLTISSSTISGNTGSHGGGIYSAGGTVALSNSTVSGNTAWLGNGGGIRGAGATLTISSSTVNDNTAAGDAGGIYGGGGPATLNSSTVNGNSAANRGGGIYNTSTLTISSSTVSGNSAVTHGGGIYSQIGTAILNNSEVSSNMAGTFGGGINAGLGTLALNRSTVSGNSAGRGGGIYNSSATATLSNSTVSGNSASVVGGGIQTSAAVTLSSSTVGANSAIAGGGGIQISSGGTMTLKNTIVASASGGDCGGIGLTSLGYNIDSDGTCGLSGTGDLSSVNPLLGPLQNNGGPTETHALLAGSPAVDAGSPDCPPPATDQRGVARPLSAACDIGAFESDLVAADVMAPVVTLTTPPEGAVYDQGQSVLAAYTCTDEAGGSGIASCVGDVAVGAAIDTATLGAKTFTVTGTDNAGNATVAIHNYTVVTPVATVTGIVTQEGVALPGARLIFVIQGTTFANILTDAGGNYSQTVPPDVDIDLRVQTPSGFIIGRESVTVILGQTLTLNFDFVPGTVVTGTVTQNGVPLPGAQALGVAFNFGTSDFTDALGRYSLTFQSGVNIDLRVFSPDGGSCIGRVLQQAPTPDVITADFDFKPATVTGTVVDIGGNPVPFARVLQVPSGIGFGCATTADAQGAYTHVIQSGLVVSIRCSTPQGVRLFNVGPLLPGQVITADCPTGPVDVTPPSVTITTPANGVTFDQGQVVPAAYTCTDEAGGSGITSCVGDVAVGAAIDTATLGPKSFTVTGTDNAGSATVVIHNYTVVDGCTAPVAAASLVLVGNGDNEGTDEDEEDDDEGTFVVAFGISNPATACVPVAISATIAGQPVTNGQIVELEVDDEELEIELEDGTLEIEGPLPQLALVVTATNSAGSDTASVLPPGLAADNDVETDDDD